MYIYGYKGLLQAAKQPIAVVILATSRTGEHCCLNILVCLSAIHMLRLEQLRACCRMNFIASHWMFTTCLLQYVCLPIQDPRL